MAMVPSSLPPPRFPRAPCIQSICPCISPSSSCLLSVRFSFIFRPPHGHRFSPAVHPYDWMAAGAMLPLFVFPASRRLMAYHPDLCGWWYLAWVWVEGVGNVPPRLFLGYSKCFTIPGFDTIDSPRYLCAHLCLPPPPPFPVQPYLYHYPPYKRKSILVVAPLALTLPVPLAQTYWRPPKRLPVPVPWPLPSPFHGHACVLVR